MDVGEREARPVMHGFSNVSAHQPYVETPFGITAPAELVPGERGSLR